MAHGVVGGLSSTARGGDFGSAFLSAGVADATTLPIIKLVGPNGGLVATAIVGGAASEIAGGDFANGAVTASFGYLFNCWAHECLNHYIEGKRTSLPAGFSELGADGVTPEDFPQIRRLLSFGNSLLLGGTYNISDQIGWQTTSLNACAAYRQVTLDLNGTLSISNGKYSFSGTLSAPPDLYDFDPQDWGVRTISGEVSTRIGSKLPGKPFENEFYGSRPVTSAGQIAR